LRNGSGKYVVKRMLAGLVDYGLYFAFFVGYCRLFGAPNAADAYEVHGCSHILVLFAVWILLLPMPEAVWGRGIGKWLADLHVAMAADLATPPNVLAVAKRHVLSFVEVGMCFGLLPLIVILSTERRQRLGDLWAGTVVIDRNER
jgi:uncharacterized RDD family membrane protein YckC